MNTTRSPGQRRRVARYAGTTAILMLFCGCATHSAGKAPLLQDTLDGRCAGSQIKQCRVWGGNKFRRRYEYCGCRQT